MSCVLRRTLHSERRKWSHSLWVVQCPRLWSRSTISGCVSLTWRSRRRYSSWMLPCHRPASSAMLSRAVPSSFWQHGSRLRRSNTSCTRGNLLLPLQLQPLSLLVAVGDPLRLPLLLCCSSSLPPGSVVEPVAGRTPSPSRPRQAQEQEAPRQATWRWRGLLIGIWCLHHSLVENLLFRFVFVLPLAQQPAVPKTSTKEQFTQSLCFKRRRVENHASREHFPPPLSPGSGWLPKSTPPAHLWNQVRAVTLKYPLQIVKRRAVTSLKLVFPPTRGGIRWVLHYTPRPRPLPSQAITGPGPGPCVSPRCPTMGTSVTLLVPLARSLGTWLALPSPSRWLLRIIRLGYVIQFARRPPKFRGIWFTSVKAVDTPVLRAEIAVLLAKDAIVPVPPADIGSGFFSPYFIVPKKSGGLWPILDLRVLNRALHKLPFKILTQKCISGASVP